jgi:D-3-phosphoglycerate dehydrogenase
VGYGHVGSQLSILAESVGMNVIFYDIEPRLALGNARACSSLDELLKKSLFVSVHVPGLPSTVNLIGEKEISTVCPSAYTDS